MNRRVIQAYCTVSQYSYTNLQLDSIVQKAKVNTVMWNHVQREISKGVNDTKGWRWASKQKESLRNALPYKKAPGNSRKALFTRRRRVALRAQSAERLVACNERENLSFCRGLTHRFPERSWRDRNVTVVSTRRLWPHLERRWRRFTMEQSTRNRIYQY